MPLIVLSNVILVPAGLPTTGTDPAAVIDFFGSNGAWSAWPPP